jgi:imidazole glycerol phosphate synthase glutamine amidotransferase subunit
MASRGIVTVVDCGHGNLASVVNALCAVGARPIVTAYAEEIMQARTLVFPGQGAAPAAMASLQQKGLDLALHEALTAGASMLGICLGMQVLLEYSEEGPTACLGLAPGIVRRFKPTPEAPKVPQIGWNRVRHSGDPLFATIPTGAYFYFVHSFYCVPADGLGIAWTDYGIDYCSALHTGNCWAVQFHPEKSGAMGLQLLRNFLELSQC